MENKVRVITNKKKLVEYFREIWNYKELFMILAKRDILVKYKQAVFGIGWAAIRPLVTTLVMALAFGRIGKLDTTVSIPFMLVVSAGVTVWLFFSQSLANISNSLIQNANLLTKVYFPRLIIPVSSVMISLVDAIVSVGVFVVFCIWYQYVPDWKVVFIPLIIGLTYLACIGIGLFAAVLNVRFRDIGQIIPFVIQFGMFISPVGYLTQSFNSGEHGSLFYKLACLNPVTGCIDAMRWAMLGDFAEFNWDSFIPLLIFLSFSLIFSFRFFRKYEGSFVDYI